MSRLQDAGRDVPRDIAVVGWDDVMTSRYVRPGMTTVRQPVHELGVLAAERLHQRVDGAPPRRPPSCSPTEVVLRGSCGCPPPAPAGAAARRPAPVPTPHSTARTPLPPRPSRHPQKVRHPMRRTTAITVACMTAAALTVTACGRERRPAAPPPPDRRSREHRSRQGQHHRLGHGRRGRQAAQLAKDFEAANPGVKVKVTAIPWDAAHDKFMTADHGEQDPGRRHGRHHVDG